MTPESAIASAGTVAIGEALEVGRLGFGAMRLTGTSLWDDPPDRDGAIAVLRRAVELGVTLIDTADSYGPHTNETLIRDALYPYPEDLVIATKGGFFRFGPTMWSDVVLACDRPHLRHAAVLSARRLGVDTIDLYYLHGVDPNVPFEEQIGTLCELRDEGLIREIGLSNITLEQFEQASRITRIAAVSNRYNVEERDDEPLLVAVEEAGAVFSPHTPMGSKKGYVEWDPDTPVEMSEPLTEIANAQGVSPEQVMLAWLLQRSPVMLPIPGTSSIGHLEANVAAATITLSPEDMLALDKLG
jgi:hypothetical protein